MSIPRGEERRLLRWYPAAFRQRYGAELLGLLEDASFAKKAPLATHLDIARAGLKERWRESGLAPESRDRALQVKAGGLWVLCAWAMAIVAGSAFANQIEQWQPALPTDAVQAPLLAIDVIQAAALVGAIAVMLGALIALPSAVRSLRQGAWRGLVPVVRGAIVLTGVLVLATVGLEIWAGHIRSVPRSEPLLGYGGGFLLWGALAALTLTAWTVAAVATMRRVELGARETKAEAALAVVVALVVAVVTAGVLVWWANVASSAPWFFSSPVARPHASPFDPTLVGVAVVLVIATVVAVAGTVRIVGASVRPSGS